MNSLTELLPERRGDRALYVLARSGRLPADALPTHVRWQLVVDFHSIGWTDVDIAEHTRMTTYTTARIRSSLGLAPNRPRAEGMTA